MPNAEPRTPLEYARLYLDAGYSVIPVARDGSKRPEGRLLPTVIDDQGDARPSWKPFQAAPPDEHHVRLWWGGGRPSGVALVAGDVSGGLELLDFDQNAHEVFWAWAKDVEDEHPGLTARLSVVETPGGFHAWVRCPDMLPPGNTVLASDPGLPGKKKRLIETRGEGGYALAPGCPPDCHPSGREYRHAAGVPLWALGPVSIDEHDWLWQCARSFDRAPPKVDPPPSPSRVGDGLRPGEDFDARGPDWAEILEGHGWRCVGTRGQERRWKRPGKDAPGWSATTGHCRGPKGEDLLRVFSTNAHPFDAEKAYGKFRALSLLRYGGDLSVAARDLGRLGYGDRPKSAGRAPSEADVSHVLQSLATADPDRLAAILGPVVRRILQTGGPSHG